MVRTSAPASSRCVANARLREWGVMRFFQPGQAAVPMADALECVAVDVAFGEQAREEPLTLRPGAPPVYRVTIGLAGVAFIVL